MSTIRTLSTSRFRLPATATLLGVAAGIAELTFGTSSWTGSKDDPTTLGWVTIALALAITAVAATAERIGTASARFAGGLAMLLAAAMGVTTAGLAWLPAAVIVAMAGASAVRSAGQERALGSMIAELRWPATLVVLACNYLLLGIDAGGGYAVVGIAGAAAVSIALAVRRRSTAVASVVLIVGTLPFAAVALWTVVLPLTAVLILAIGLPFLLGSPRFATSGS